MAKLSTYPTFQMAALKSHNFSLPYNFLIGGDGETYEVRGWTEQSGFSFVPHNSSLTIGILGKTIAYALMTLIEISFFENRVI